MALNERDRRAVTLGAVALAIIAAYFLVIEPLANAYDGLVAEHDRLAARVARAIQDNRKAEYYTKRIADYEQSSGELTPPPPYDEQITTVGGQIIAAAQKSGVQLKGFTPTAATIWAEDPALALASFHVDVEVQWPQPKRAAASWENVFKLIANLYRIPGVLSVERLDLSSPASKGGAGGPGGRRGPGKGGKIVVRLTISVLVKASAESDGPWAE
jgi:hypothetical protein